MSGRVGALVALGAVGVAAAALIGVELANGAAGYGETTAKEACTATSDFPGEGLDPTIQRVVLSGLYGAACELGTTREELVLSFAPSVEGGAEIEWDRPTIARAVRSGLTRAIDDAEQTGDIGGVEALVLREVVKRAPIDFLVRSGESIRDLIDRIQGGDLGGLLDQIDPSKLEDLLGSTLEDLVGKVDLGALLEGVLGGD
jgi:hypothetical protein